MKPIAFTTEMIQAIIGGRKIQDRRPLKNKVTIGIHDNGSCYINNKYEHNGNGDISVYTDQLIEELSSYQVGDILYAKEKFARGLEDGFESESETNPTMTFYFADGKNMSWIDGDGDPCNVPWKSSIHMTEEYSRIFLEVVSVKLEKLQDICKKSGGKGFHAEGYLKFWCNKNPIDWYSSLWDETAKVLYKWEQNPYVFVYEFKKVAYKQVA